MHTGAWPTGGRQVLAGRPAVLELGSGTGIAGMACACAGAGSVILTDLPQAVPKLEEAIDANEAALEASNATVTAAALAWGDPDACYDVAPEGVDLVVGADLLYNPANFDALLVTMLELAQIRGARILLATENRWGTVNSQWDDALMRSGLEQVGEPITLPAPSRLPRPVVLVELAPREGGKAGQPIG
jgi:predicted nicotinamide N-methyase